MCYKNCPICRRTGELFEENNKIPDRDYEGEIKKLEEEIEKLKETIDFKSDICKAAKKGKLNNVQYLIERCHVDVETKDKDGWTPINIASFYGHLDIVKYLYESWHTNVMLTSSLIRQNHMIKATSDS